MSRKQPQPAGVRAGIKDFIRHSILGKPRHDASFSQAGEDRVMAFLFEKLQIAHPTYLDIGANNPIHLSNTYYFYQKGGRGVCIEPNPVLFDQFRSVRPRDTTLNVGIGPKTEQSLPFYLFGPEADGLSTFCKEHADHSEKTTSYRIKQVIEVEIKTANQILEAHFDRSPDLLSIDVEGLDEAILRAYDFENFAPAVVCAETHSLQGSRYSKESELSDLILSKGYRLYADTYLNSIFLRQDLAEKHCFSDTSLPQAG